MKITIESTTQIVDINNGVQARIWEGQTESGIPVVALITRIAADKDQNLEQLYRELKEQRLPTWGAAVYGARMFFP